jgi:hypothetical protein
MNTLVHASNVVLNRTDCAHAQTRLEVLPSDHQHYVRVVCEVCGKQLCWKANPTNVERRRLNAISIQRLLGSSRLTEWENGFCQGISQNPRLGPKQQALLDRLVEKYLKEDIHEVAKRSDAARYNCAA